MSAKVTPFFKECYKMLICFGLGRKNPPIRRIYDGDYNYN